MMTLIKSVLFLTVCFCYLSHFIAFAEKASECVLSASESCSIDALTGITSVFPGGETRCVFENDGKVGPKANSTYYFQVFPGRNADKNKVMLYFQGGGSCFNDNQCGWGLKCLQSNIFYNINIREDYGGVFDKENELNPYKDWTIIHVLYCTGDIHLGNYVRPHQKNRRLSEEVASILSIKQRSLRESCSTLDRPAHHVGAKNTNAVLSWMYANFPNPQHLVIGGCSAGALGAQIHAHNIIKKYKTQLKSQVKISVIADGFLGAAPNFAASKILRNFKACSIDYGMTSKMMDACAKGELTTAEIMKYYMKKHSTIPFSIISSKYDKTQKKFYNILAGSNPVDDVGLYKELNVMMVDYAKAVNNVVIYLVDGNDHCFSQNPRFYNTIANALDFDKKQLPLSTWMSQVSLSSGKIVSYCTGELKDSATTNEQKANWCDKNLVNAFFTRPSSTPTTKKPSASC